MRYNRRPMSRRLSPRRRYELTEYLRAAAQRRGLSYEDLAELTERRLREAVAKGDAALDDDERRLAGEIEVGVSHVSRLMTFPANPLGTPSSRVRFLGLVLALGVDRSEASRLAGGL